MDASLKKRLIGAAILVLIAAIVLPMFLSSPPPRHDGTTTVPVQVPPAPDRDLSQITVPIGDAADEDRIVAIDTGASGREPEPADEPVPFEPTPAAPETCRPPQRAQSAWCRRGSPTAAAN